MQRQLNLSFEKEEPNDIEGDRAAVHTKSSTKTTGKRNKAGGLVFVHEPFDVIAEDQTGFRRKRAARNNSKELPAHNAGEAKHTLETQEGLKRYLQTKAEHGSGCFRDISTDASGINISSSTMFRQSHQSKEKGEFAAT